MSQRTAPELLGEALTVMEEPGSDQAFGGRRI